MKAKPKFPPPNQDQRQSDAAKTSRLRALRLAKEASDREAAALQAAANPKKPAPRRRAVQAASETSSG